MGLPNVSVRPSVRFDDANLTFLHCSQKGWEDQRQIRWLKETTLYDDLKMALGFTWQFFFFLRATLPTLSFGSYSHVSPVAK